MCVSVLTLSVVVSMFGSYSAGAEPSHHEVSVVPQGKMPNRVHVFEDFETDIERRWWLRGKIESKDLPQSLSKMPNRRAMRAVETLNFDRKMGDRVNKVKGVIFNPVPGPPMGERTRLSFRYRLKGTDSLKVQIYSLSKNYHRYLLLKGLPQNEWRSATVDMTKARRPDGSGGPLARDERIDDIQFYVAKHAELLIDDIVLYDAAPPGELRDFPARTIFTGWFDTGKQGKEWPGNFEIVLHKKPRTWDAAKSVVNEKTGRSWLRIGLRGRRTVSPVTTIAFEHLLSKPSPIAVVLFDSKTGHKQSIRLRAMPAGKWSSARAVFVNQPEQRMLFADEIWFLVQAADTTLQVDDVLVYEPRSHLADTLHFPKEKWSQVRPKAAGFNEDKLKAFSTFVEGRGCVTRYGYMVYQWGDASRRADIASAAKPFYSHFLWRAIEQGKIKSVDEPVVEWEPRLKSINKALDFKDRAIRWRDFANQTSCYQLAETPGTAYAYNDWQMALFWDTLFLKVYKATYDDVDEKVFRQLTAQLQCEDSPTMMAFGAGNRPGRVAISVRDFARFGLLYLRQGSWNDHQLIRRKHAAMAVSNPLSNSIPRAGRKLAEMIAGQRSVGSRSKPDNQTDHFGSYSWLWWTNGVDRNGTRMFPDAPHDLYGAFGHGGPRAIWVIPSLDIVVSYNDAKMRNWVSGRQNPTNTAMKLLMDAVETRRR